MQIIDILQLLVPNVWTAISQLCASAVLFFLMYKLAYKPVKKILDTRSEFEQAKLTEAEKLQAENEETNKRAKEIVAEANKTAEDIVDSAKREAEELKSEMLLQAQKQSNQIIDDAKTQAKVQHDKAMKDMHNEIVDIAIMAAEKMLKEKVDTKADVNNIESFIKEVVQDGSQH